MATDIGAFGLHVNIVSMRTFPYGFSVEDFAHDMPPIEVTPIDVGDHVLLADGSMFSFDKSSAASVKIAVIPMSKDDENMGVLLRANHSSGKVMSFFDNTIMTITYPGVSPFVLSNGYVRRGPIAPSVNMKGMMRGNVYEFVFGEYTGTTGKGMAASAMSALRGIF